VSLLELTDPKPPALEDAGGSPVIAPSASAITSQPAPSALASLPASTAPRLSIVVPGLNEADSLAELAERIHANVRDRISYEIIFVDDGSIDRTWEVIRELRAQSPTVKGIRLRKNFGKATALTAGFNKAAGEIIITMDADLQDDPDDIPKFLAKIDEGLDVVVGWKVNRLDPTNRLILSRIFNGTVRLVTGVHLHDMNCGFKAYRREVIRTIPMYGDLFRFFPALAASQGFLVTEVPVRHHPRKFGSSRYGLERILRGFFDLLSIVFLTRYSKKPMHLFGLIGLGFAGIGFCINGYLTVLWFLGHKIGDRPLLLLGTLMIILGIQFFSMGFLGEFLTFLHQKRPSSDDLPIKDEL
jgi:glycosyltransferase involved in cell wall biosynthesis